jgi:hypothetical protein
MAEIGRHDDGGSEPSVGWDGWDGLAPHIEHPTRECIVEAVRWIGPLSAADLRGVLGGDSNCHLAHVSYHVIVLVDEDIVVEVGRRTGGALFEKVYDL